MCPSSHREVMKGPWLNTCTDKTKQFCLSIYNHYLVCTDDLIVESIHMPMQ